MFAFQDSRGAVEVAFTDRHGGVSGPRFASLNLAASGDADPDTVEENIDLVTAAFVRGLETRTSGTPGPPLVRMSQVHGSHVHVVDHDYLAEPGSSPPVADALVTREPGVLLMVRAADCAPVLLADVENGVVGAAHAGRPGLVAGVVPATVKKMRELGAGAMVGWVGPHVCGRCYEVPAAMRDEVARTVPESYAETSWGTPAVDIGAGVRAQLEADGVESVAAARCTLEDEDLYSYRRQGKESGRMAGLVWVRP